MTEPPTEARAHATNGAPSDWVVRWLAGLPAAATVLDFASGSGRHARHALASGASVLAVDRDPVALAAVGPGVERIECDLEHSPWPFADRRFDAIVCCNFLFRPRLDLLASLLAAGGRLVYETFAAGNARYGRPSNPAFLLEPGELLALARRAGLTVVAYEHGYAGDASPAIVERLCAVRGPFEPERLPLADRTGPRDAGPRG